MLKNAHHVPNTPIVPNLNFQNSVSYSNTKKFSLYLSWNSNGWKFVKRRIVLSISTRFLNHYSYVFRKKVMVPMVLDIYVKVTLLNYKYFQKRIDPNMPGSKGLYLGFHVSCQAILINNSYTHLVSLSSYSL